MNGIGTHDAESTKNQPKVKKKVEEKKTKHRGGSSAGNLLFSDRVIYTILTVKALSSLCDVQ